MDVGDPMFPITGWEILTMPAQGATAIRFHFLSHSMQSIEQSQPGRIYALSLNQLVQFRQKIDDSIRKLESAGIPPEPGTRQ